MSRAPLVGGFLAVVCLVLGAGAVHAQSTFLGKDRGDWQKELDSGDAKVRRGAAFALGKLGRNAALSSPILAGRLQKDPDASVREAAAFALGEIGSVALNYEPKLTQILIGVIQGDQEALVRRSAVLALGSVAGKEPEVLEALGRAAGDANPAVRQNVAFVLGKLGPKAVEALRRTLTDDDPLVIRDSANALSRLNKDARPAVPQLVGSLGKPGLDGETRKAVVTTLVKLVDAKDKEAIDALSRVLRDPDPEVRINAALALGNIGGGEAAVAVAVLREALKQSDAAIRSQAAAALKNIGPQAAPAVPDLVASLNDKNEQVRILSAVALGSIGKDAASAVPDLVHVLKKKNEQFQVRAFAAVGLAMIGPCDAAVQAVPDIMDVLTDRNAPYPVRERAMWAIRVHNTKLRDMKAVLDGLEKLLSEPRREGANMLRYDAAYMLGMLLGEEAPAKTLDVLHDFLFDSSIRIYEGNTTQAGGGAKEGMTAETAKVQEKGTGDGRTMAIQALREMGRARVMQRPEIVKQLRAIAADSSVNKKLREETKSLLAAFQLN
jgi:HEAT repeat protein